MRLLFTLLAAAALGFAVWSAQWSYLREGAERINRITGRRQVEVCRKEGIPQMTLEQKKQTLASMGIKVDPAAASLDPVHEELLRSRLAAQQIRTICIYQDAP
jgi:hypothetical protein